ncbi:MAG: hypothetical protein ABSB24_14655 [Gaiellaceae bacterium]
MERVRKSRPFSIRLSQTTDRFVAAEAQRTRRSKGAIVEALTEEAARMRRFPGIAFRGEDAMREAWVIGTGLDVWELIEMLQDYGSVERLVAETAIPERAVELARAYHAGYPEEIDRAIAENRRPLSELRELYPFAGFTLAGTDE